jgi:hypothetical protein
MRAAATTARLRRNTACTKRRRMQLNDERLGTSSESEFGRSLD